MDIQKRLGLKPDGIFGPKTEAAVFDLQRRNGLRIDGIVGPQTRGAMQKPKGSVDFGPLTIRYPGHEPVSISAGWDRESNLLRRGSRGTEVMDLQKRLGLKPDGIFGPKTEAAVFDFQRRNRLRADGIVGPQTRGCFNDPLRAALRKLR
jgi:peptidoglycan hydrolase-like protein with peptidoglycan-binding domain